MSVQALGSTLPKLCTIFLEDPQEISNSHNCTGYIYKIAAVICAVALVAIFTGAMALYLGMIADLPGWAVAIALISAMGCMKGLEFWGSGNQQFAEAREYQAYADTYNQIKNTWDVQDIGNFFVAQRLLNEQEGPIAFELEDENEQRALTEKSPASPLMALLPLIARYKVLDEQTQKLSERVTENAQKALLNYQEGQREPSKAPLYDKLEFDHAFTLLQLSEELAFNHLNQAILLQNLIHPTQKYKLKETDQGLALKMKGEEQPLGYVKRKEPMIRMLDYIAPRVPAFFVTERGTLSKDHMIANHPNAIRQTIFDPTPLEEQAE